MWFNLFCKKLKRKLSRAESPSEWLLLTIPLTAKDTHTYAHVHILPTILNRTIARVKTFRDMKVGKNCIANLLRQNEFVTFSSLLIFDLGRTYSTEPKLLCKYNQFNGLLGFVSFVVDVHMVWY